LTTYVPDKLQEIAPYNSANWYLVVFYGALFFMELIITNRKGEQFTVFYDECDHELIVSCGWCVLQNRVVGQYGPRGKKKWRRLYRVMLGIEDPKVFIDHINGNTLDNRRSNLRVCSKAQNSWNTGNRGGDVPYKGVSIHTDPRVKPRQKPLYVVYIGAAGKRKNLGYFDCPIEAAKAYDKKAREWHGEFARLNFPDQL